VTASPSLHYWRRGWQTVSLASFDEVQPDTWYAYDLDDVDGLYMGQNYQVFDCLYAFEDDVGELIADA
jgi:hypothetical protein